ncbi:sulfatase, partial [Halorubrum sp. SD626R]
MASNTSSPDGTAPEETNGSAGDLDSAGASSEPDADRPDVSNVLLVTIDSLRADAIAPYDRDRHSPVLQGLADGGTVFDNAFATGNWTPFSFPSILAS